MAWDSDAKKVATKAVGTVESNLKWDLIYYPDAITVGFVQFYGAHAAILLKRIRNVLQPLGQWSVTSRVDSALTNNPVQLPTGTIEQWNWWANFHLTTADGNSIKPMVRTAAGKQLQIERWEEMMESYHAPALSRGLNRETHPASFCYYVMLHHQSPRYSNQVLNQAGSNPSVARLHSIALNHSWYSRFKNRLNTARGIIDRWETDIPDEYIPDEWGDGDAGDGGSGGDDGAGGVAASGPTRIARGITSIALVGSSLHVRTRDGVIIAEPTPTGQLWLPRGGVQDAGPPIEPATDEPNDDEALDPESPASQIAAQLRQWLIDRIEKYAYSQTHRDRLNADKSNVTDCSGLMYSAYRAVLGSKITTSNFGTYTVTQNQKGRNIRSFQNSIVPESLLQVGDLVFYSYDSARVRHVEMYIGNGQLIGWGGNTRATPSGRGPYIKPSYTGYFNNYRGAGRRAWGSSARRHLPDF